MDNPLYCKPWMLSSALIAKMSQVHGILLHVFIVNLLIKAEERTMKNISVKLKKGSGLELK